MVAKTILVVKCFLRLRARGEAVNNVTTYITLKDSYSQSRHSVLQFTAY